MNPIILIGSGIILLGIGIGLGYWIAHSQRNREATKVSDIQQELDAYRRNVTEHFGATAQHFQSIGEQYQSLYKHMVQGADALCDPAQSEFLLDFAADAAPAAKVEDEPEAAPEVIKDYAPEEEIESQQKEVEAAELPDVPEDTLPSDDVTTASSVEDAATEQVVPPTDVEPERTVH